MSAAEAYAREFCRSNNLDYERHKDSVANSWLEKQHAALTDRLKKLQGKLDKANKKRSEYKELYKNLKDHTQSDEEAKLEKGRRVGPPRVEIEEDGRLQKKNQIPGHTFPSFRHQTVNVLLGMLRCHRRVCLTICCSTRFSGGPATDSGGPRKIVRNCFQRPAAVF